METIRAPLGPSLQVGTWLADGVDDWADDGPS